LDLWQQVYNSEPTKEAGDVSLKEVEQETEMPENLPYLFQNVYSASN
jgi:hypothetical protein